MCNLIMSYPFSLALPPLLSLGLPVSLRSADTDSRVILDPWPPLPYPKDLGFGSQKTDQMQEASEALGTVSISS